MSSESAPRDIGLDEKTRKAVTEMLESPDGLFSKIYGRPTMKDVFMMALAFGVRHKTSLPLTKRKGAIPITTFSDTDRAIVAAVAVEEEGGLDILLNQAGVFKIAEEYANGGFPLLKDAIDQADQGLMEIQAIEDRVLQRGKK